MEDKEVDAVSSEINEVQVSMADETTSSSLEMAVELSMKEPEETPIVLKEAPTESEATPTEAESTSTESEDTPIAPAKNTEDATTSENIGQTSDPCMEQTIDVETVMKMFEGLNKKFDEKIAVDAQKNQLFDKMYAELSSYKNDIYQKIMKPIILDVIMLIDDTNKFVRDTCPGDAKKVYNALRDIPDDLLEILERNGIEAFYDESEVFNPKTQRVLKTIPTNKSEWDNKIESRLRHGYKWDEKVIKPEMIQCYKYSQTN